MLEAVATGRRLKARLLSVRREMRALLKEAYVAEGAIGVARFLAALLLRVSVNRDKVWSYKRLGLLPQGTLGREYWAHLTALGYRFPGEPAGIADSVAYHFQGGKLPGLAVEEDIAGRNGVAFRSFRRVFSSGDPQDPRGTCCG